MNNNWMHPVLIEPTDTLFLRDSIPMSAGQGRGAGARLPLPSTLHEAVRASLFEKHGRSDERAAFRPGNVPRSGGWLGKGKTVESMGSKDFQSLQVAGPLPYLEPREGKPGGLHFPLPLDVVFDEAGRAHMFTLLAPSGTAHSSALPALAVSPAPAKKDQPSGFISTAAMSGYFSGELAALDNGSAVAGQSAFFELEYRIGVALDPATQSAADGQLFAATHARPSAGFRLAAWMGLKKPVNGESDKLTGLDFLLLGGERRLARLHRGKAALTIPPPPVIPESDGPCLLKWVLATPARFAHGWLPGWCRDSRKDRPPRPDRQVCLSLTSGSAHLIAACLGKPLAFAGWDTVEQQSKPTQLAVPAGSVYYFLCSSAAAARELAALLHWRPRSDVFGEKGFGYGLTAPVSGPMSPDIQQLARQLLAP